MTGTKSTLHLIAEHLALALGPLREVTTDLNQFKVFMLRLGWEVNNLPPSYANLATRVSGLISAVEALDENASPSDMLEAIRGAGDVYRAMNNLTDAPSGADKNKFLSEFGERLFDLLFVEYMTRALPATYNLLEIMGVIEREEHTATATRPAFVRNRLFYSRITDIITDPGSIPARVYGWGTPDLDFNRLSGSLVALADAVGLLVSLEQPEIDLAAGFQEGDLEQIAGPIDRLVRLGFFEAPVGDELFEVSLQILEHPAEGSHLPGIIIQPLVPKEIGTQYQIDENTVLKIRAESDLSDTFGVVIRPGDILIRYPFQPGQSLPDAGFGATLSHSPPESALMLGSANTTRLEFQGGDLGLEINHLAGSLEVILGANLRNLALIVAGGESDSFIRHLTGDRDLKVDIPLGAEWSNVSGFHLKGGGFEVNLPSHLEIGIITVNGIQVQVKAPEDGNPRIENTIGVNFNGQLGPLTVTVQSLGLKLELVFVDGNAGPFDVGLGFKPPDGLGLSIDGGGFTGGGFLRYVESDQRYEGALELEYEDRISLKAIGLLTSRLPGGQSGFSLLIIITAEFTPIQLGLGFTLNAIGGLLGLNRTADVERLRSGLRDNSLSSVLFPQNVVENASRLLSDLNQLFPGQPDRFIFGPMARIGWGTPTLITIDLGLLIEIPDPVRVLLLGVIRALLPDDNARLLQLQVNFLGVIDFEARRLSFDASLYDSKLLTYTLSGDMAVRLSWGAEPNFLLTVGGFHPAYQPPPLNLPTLRRLSLQLLSGNNPRLTLETYFAITSNTVQFGAKIELLAKAGSFSVYGFLSFDVLFQFNPFYFIAQISAKLALRAGSSEIASISLDFSLEGPTPWHAKGTAKLKICWFLTIKVRFDKTFGEPRNTRLDDIPVLPLLQAALSDPGNWETQPPGSHSLLVTLKQIETGRLIVYPFGVLNIRQKVVPLGIEIQRIGSQRPSDGTRFSISDVAAGEGSQAESFTTDPVSELFAPAQFFEISDTEKLSSKAFERYTGGVKLKDSEEFDGEYALRRVVSYDLIYIDEQRNVPRKREVLHPDAAAFRSWALHGAVANSPLSYARRGKSALAPDPVRVGQEAFAVVSASDLRPVMDGAAAGSEAGARRQLDELIRANPALEGEILVVPAFEVNRS